MTNKCLVLEGKTLSDQIIHDLYQKVISFNIRPKLVVILIGNNFASQLYVEKKQKIATYIGFESQVIKFNEDVSEKTILDTINFLNKDKKVNAILVQMPIPKHISYEKVVETILPQKDVDGFHPYNLGKILSGFTPFAYPCTPLGIIKLLNFYKIGLERKNVCIVGRSNIVGKPLSIMLLNRNATVVICHSKTKNLKNLTLNSDIVIVATGKKGLLTKNMVKKQAVIIDVGINRDENNRLCGDVDFQQVCQVATAVTPVPKGVGPMTIATLMTNTFNLYLMQHNLNIEEV